MNMPIWYLQGVDKKLDNILDVNASMKIKKIRVFIEEIMMCVERYISHNVLV